MNNKLSPCGLKGDWMQVYSGRAFYCQDPRPDQFTLECLAAGLAKECRYGGQGKLWLHYSVAEHCIIGMRYFLKRGMVREAILFLFHDSPEGLIKDLMRSLKKAVAPCYKPIEEKFEEVVFNKYLGSDTLDRRAWWRDEDLVARVKEIDNRILVNEKRLLMRHDVDWGPDFNALVPLDDADFDAQCYKPEEAFAAWLAWVHQLAASYPEYLTTKGD